MEDLFAEIAGPVVKVSGGSERDRKVEEAWRLWCDETRRPDARRPDRKFTSTYRELLRTHSSHERLLRGVRAAARTPPRPRDPRDLRRVLMVLENAAHERAAVSLLDEGAEVVPYPRPDVVALACVSDVERVCGTHRTAWTSRDHEAAGVLIGELDAGRLDSLSGAVKLHTGLTALLPVDLLRHVGIDPGARGRKNASRDSYGAGEVETASYEGTLVDVDLDAERLRLRGVRVADVLAFHAKAPTGYWSSVLDRVEASPSTPITAIYDELAASYDGWHPRDRSAP